MELVDGGRLLRLSFLDAAPIEDVAAALVELAREHGSAIGVHRGVELRVTPKSTVSSIIADSRA